MAKSSTLLLLICSNTKVTGGENKYEPSLAVAAQLSPKSGGRLMLNRRRAKQVVRSKNVSRDGVPLVQLPYNRELKDGQDFDGIELGARYLPAAQRYQGRFYAELGEAGPDLLANSLHHILILSGLYGLLTPGEPIQAYSCHVHDHPDIRRLWQDDDCITELLNEYLTRHSITRLVDMTGEAAYRNLVSWRRISSRTRVLHCFGEQNAGPAVLRALAVTARHLIEKVPIDGPFPFKSGASFETRYERIFFQDELRPPTGAPEEMELLHGTITVADELGRMRRNIVRIIDQLESGPKQGLVGARLARLEEDKKIPAPQARAIRQLLDERNSVEYDLKRLDAEALATVRRDYATIEAWGRKRGLDMPEDV